jgi:hypothetical protein
MGTFTRMVSSPGMKNVLLTAFLCLLFSSALFGQASAPKYSNEFLSIGVGARGLGMSRTQAAVANDVTAGYWNPAGLTDIASRYEVSLMHAEYFAGMAKYDYAAFATSIDSLSHLAVSAIRFGIDDIPDTRFLYDANGAINYDNIRFFSAADYAFLISYARKIPQVPGLRLGVNAKIVHRVAGNFATAWGFGLDAGAQLVRNKWRFGLMARDVTSTFNAWSHNSALVYETYAKTGNQIPENSIEITLPKMVLGAARSFAFGPRVGLLAAVDLDFTFDGKRNTLIRSSAVSLDPHAGIELDYQRLVFFRAGIGDIQRVKNFDSSHYTAFQPNMGAGFRINKFSIDYAFTDIGNRAESLYSHVFSVKASF